ncbi:hypothetical protein SCE1572_42425 [Sorangium cellulosum So0157-2]|uniref:Uncharacterized protein n=1 Tax=Sorangium cellulosum So0157-2 TaxID=1254432 RepID=S4Y6W8_SORCE|nr:hypothetical protein SCE1572_42425 [Sorangium cellulosum So0157-2]
MRSPPRCALLADRAMRWSGELAGTGRRGKLFRDRIEVATPR